MAPRYPSAPPASGYRAPLCTETDGPAPFLDCVPASVVMMLDVWTQGRVRLTHQNIARAADGNRTYSGVAPAVVKLANIEMRFSEALNANSTEEITWAELLDRLSRGGAASVVGFYNRLIGHKSLAGRDLIRHDRHLATSTTVRHAMTVSNAEKALDRIWLQDPMGIPPFKGEWIKPESLHAFVDKTGNAMTARVTAAVTPDPDRFPPDGGSLNDYLKTMSLVANRKAVVRAGATPRSKPAFDGRDPTRFKLAAPFRTGRKAPLVGWVEGTNLTLADGTIFERSTKWAALHNPRWGIYFAHERDIGEQSRIER